MLHPPAPLILVTSPPGLQQLDITQFAVVSRDPTCAPILAILCLVFVSAQSFIVFGEAEDLRKFNEAYETIKYYLRKG